MKCFEIEASVNFSFDIPFVYKVLNDTSQMISILILTDSKVIISLKGEFVCLFSARRTSPTRRHLRTSFVDHLSLVAKLELF